MADSFRLDSVVEYRRASAHRRPGRSLLEEMGDDCHVFPSDCDHTNSIGSPAGERDVSLRVRSFVRIRNGRGLYADPAYGGRAVRSKLVGAGDGDYPARQYHWSDVVPLFRLRSSRPRRELHCRNERRTSSGIDWGALDHDPAAAPGSPRESRGFDTSVSLVGQDDILRPICNRPPLLRRHPDRAIQPDYLTVEHRILDDLLG